MFLVWTDYHDYFFETTINKVYQIFYLQIKIDYIHVYS
jgi:hypothetical protein